MKKRSLNFKLIIVMGILVSGAVTIAVIGLSRLEMMNVTLKKIVDEDASRVSIIKDIRSLFHIQLINEKNFLLDEDPKELALISERLINRNKEMEDTIAKLYAISSEKGKAELVQFKEIYGSWWTNVQELKVQKLGGNLAKAREISFGPNRQHRRAAETLIDGTVERNEKHMQEEIHEMEERYSHARAMMILFSSLAVLVGGAVGAIVLTGLSRSIGYVIENLNLSSGQVSAASHQIATAATQLSEATTEQASSLEETVATIEELSSMVKLNADNASMASQLSAETNSLAVRGESEMKMLVDSMSEISKDSKKIADIITLIDDIAFQTNLLALNAAVEAARAGEQGKGFAVVAEAVRTLSQRSSAAAKDIGDLIRTSVDRIETGSEQAQKSGTVLNDIVNSVKKVTQLNQEIATASTEQSNGIMQISKAMNQLDQVTQVNASSSEEAAASAEELSAQADTLSQVIVSLVESIKGSVDKASIKENTPPRKASVATFKPKPSAAKKDADKNDDLLPLDDVG